MEHREAHAGQSQPSQATPNSGFLFLISLRFLTNLDTGSKKDHFYLFNGPKAAQKIWILVKKRALKFFLHAYISKYFRQTNLPPVRILYILASSFHTVLTSISSNRG